MFQNNYEAVFILTPVLSEAQMKDAVEKFKKVLTDNGAELLNEESWGLRKLAYTIQHKNTGYYQLLQFKASPAIIAILETEYKRDERVMRYLTVKLDKYGAEYAEKRAKGLVGKKDAPAELVAPSQDKKSKKKEATPKAEEAPAAEEASVEEVVVVETQEATKGGEE
jgi:small subunit ribosomal protein S6